MRAAIADAAAELDLSIGELLANTTLVIYGTTRATNAIVTKTTAKTAFLITAGFPDVLLLKEGGKFRPHDFCSDYPRSVHPPASYVRDRRADQFRGRGVVPAESVARAPHNRRPWRPASFEAVAVCLAVVDCSIPLHEIAVGELIEEMLPGVPYTLSHQLITRSCANIAEPPPPRSMHR